MSSLLGNWICILRQSFGKKAVKFNELTISTRA